jgi:hypothetical protein
MNSCSSSKKLPPAGKRVHSACGLPSTLRATVAPATGVSEAARFFGRFVQPHSQLPFTRPPPIPMRFRAVLFLFFLFSGWNRKVNPS